MLVPTLPEARYLILDDADAPSTVAAVLASERWGGRGPAPVLVPAWWRADADACMPLVHGAVARHAAVLGLRTLAEELVVEPGEAPGGAGVVSQLLLAAVQMADRAGCDAVLFPVRAADFGDAAEPSVGLIAREVDRAVLVGRLASLDADAPRTVVTPLVDLDDEQLVDLARDLGVAAESCWWAGRGSDSVAAHAARRWSGLSTLPAGLEPEAGRMIRSA
jgi:hypothetical protein